MWAADEGEGLSGRHRLRQVPLSVEQEALELIVEGSQGRGREKAGRAGTRGLGYTLFTSQAVEIPGEQVGPVMPPLRVNRGVCVCVCAAGKLQMWNLQPQSFNQVTSTS